MYQADLYISNNDLQRHDVCKVINNSMNLIKWNQAGHETVADLGCGSGDVTKGIILANAPKIKCLIGVDISQEMLAFARQFNAHDKIQYKHMDLATKHISNKFIAKFDHAFSFHVFHWIKNQRQLFKNIYQMLKPGGDMLGHFVVNSDVMLIYKKQSQMPRWSKYLKNVTDIFPYQQCQCPQEAIEENLSNTGFSHIVKIEKREFIYSSRDNFKISMAVINPFIKFVPKKLHDYFMNDFVDIAGVLNFFPEHDKPNSIVIVPYNLAVVYLRKPDM